ncbi:MAG: hypothetical protein RIB58_04225 [Phycisphaerales bacterium]
MGLSLDAIVAQSSPGSGGDTGRFLAWVGILIAVVVVGTVFLVLLRKHVLTHRGEERSGFATLEEMRTLVARGEMSKEEYEQVRKAMIAKVRSSPESTEKAAPTPDDGSPEQGRNGSRSNR